MTEQEKQALIKRAAWEAEIAYTHLANTIKFEAAANTVNIGLLKEKLNAAMALVKELEAA